MNPSNLSNQELRDRITKATGSELAILMAELETRAEFSLQVAEAQLKFAAKRLESK